MKKSSFSMILLVFILVLPTTGLAQDQALPQFPGQIAYIGADYNVYTFDANTPTHNALTDNSGRSGGIARLYQWPTWSADGRLAYFESEVNVNASRRQLEVYVSPDGVELGRSVYRGPNQNLSYAYWSPENCTGADNCRELALLIGEVGVDGFVVELVRDVEGETSNRQIGTGAPYYYSWSPDGTRMLWHRNNERLDIYNVVDDTIDLTFNQEPGVFAAPAWSPVDDRLLFAVPGASLGRTDLIMLANDEVQTLATDLGGQVAFAWAPDGNQIAYFDEERVLYIVDAITGERVVRSPNAGILAFFWAPNSDLIAYVTLSTASGSFNASAEAPSQLVVQRQQSTSLVWSVLLVEDGSVRRFSNFIPTNEMIYLLTYFDQFAQSHRVWSPDSRHLLYSEITEDNAPVISLLNITQSIPVPLNIADGVIGVWSFE